MNASQARKQAEQNALLKASAELEKVRAKIKVTVSNGGTYLQLEKPLSYSAQKILESEGYRYSEWSDPRDKDSGASISW